MNQSPPLLGRNQGEERIERAFLVDRVQRQPVLVHRPAAQHLDPLESGLASALEPHGFQEGAGDSPAPESRIVEHALRQVVYQQHVGDD